MPHAYRWSLYDTSEVTAVDAAKRTGWSERTIRRRLKAGKIEATKESGKWIIDVETIPLRKGPKGSAARERAILDELAKLRAEVEEVKESYTQILRELHQSGT